MKIKNSKISIYLRDEGMKIELIDSDASTMFAEVSFNQEQTCQALGGLGYTHCDLKVLGLDRVGKQMEHKEFTFKIAANDDPTKYTVRVWDKNIKKEAVKAAERKCPKG